MDLARFLCAIFGGSLKTRKNQVSRIFGRQAGFSVKLPPSDFILGIDEWVKDRGIDLATGISAEDRCLRQVRCEQADKIAKLRDENTGRAALEALQREAALRRFEPWFRRKMREEDGYRMPKLQSLLTPSRVFTALLEDSPAIFKRPRSEDR